MPIIVNSKKPHPFLPSSDARSIDSDAAAHQDIRPLELLVFVLMKEKERTEKELADWLGKTDLQVNITFAATDSYLDEIAKRPRTPGSASAEEISRINHIEGTYHRFSEIRNKKFDAVMMTGVNATEQDPTKEKIWPEIKAIFDWTTTHATMCWFKCWAGQAALQHFHGIERKRSPQKTYGVHEHRTAEDRTGLFDGFADVYPIPVSRWNEVKASDIREKPQLDIVSISDKAGVGVVAETAPFYDGTKHYPKRVYDLVHPEYSTATLKAEYDRDSAKNPNFPLPHGYFPADNPKAVPVNTWRHTGQVFANWVSLVYKATQYDLEQVPQPFRRPLPAKMSASSKPR